MNLKRNGLKNVAILACGNIGSTVMAQMTKNIPDREIDVNEKIDSFSLDDISSELETYEFKNYHYNDDFQMTIKYKNRKCSNAKRSNSRAKNKNKKTHRKKK